MRRILTWARRSPRRLAEIGLGIGYGCLLASLPACGGSHEAGDDVRAFVVALPTADDVLVEVPEVQTDAASLEAAGAGRSRRALVGEPATFYTHSYYQAKEINGLAASVIDILDEIASYPPTTFTGTVAVWGPFSEPFEPNEFKVTVAKNEASALHFGWKIAGRHKSGVADFATLARGSFEPDSADGDQRNGRGWMFIDFGRIHELEQSNEGAGDIRYRFTRTDAAVHVKAIYQGPDEEGQPATVAYGFGANAAGDGFILFGLSADIHSGEDGANGANDDGGAGARDAKEDLLIRTRWRAEGGGRSDVVARGGDLMLDEALVSQCWSETFVSTYESMAINGSLIGEEGDETSCALDSPELPDATELPSVDDVTDPFSSTSL